MPDHLGPDDPRGTLGGPHAARRLTVRDRLHNLRDLRAVRHRAKWRAIFAIRAVRAAALTDQPVRFVLADLLPGTRLRAYRVGGVTVPIEHGTGDTWIFQELFLDGDYAGEVSRAPKRVADIGGNVGMFTLWASTRWPDADIVAFEPDPANAARYRRALAVSGLEARLIEAAAATEDGELRFADGLHGGSHIAADGGRVVQAVDVFPHLSGIDLVKLDIEGGEWALLGDPRFAELDASDVLLEYHPWMCPGPDARHEAEQALQRAGFQVEAVRHDGDSHVGVMRGYR